MRNCVVLSVFLAAVAGAGTAGAQGAPAVENVPLAERAYVASEIYSAVEIYFAGWQGVPDFDFRAAYKAYLVEALAAPNRRQFDLDTMEFMAELRNGHTGFADEWLDQHYGQPLGYYADWVRGQWVVTQSQRAGLKPGDVIVAINSQPIEQFYGRVKKYIPASTERWRRHSLFVDFPYLFPGRFTLTLAGGRRVTIDRPAEKIALPPRRVEARWVEPGKLGYIRIPSFAGEGAFERAALVDLKQFPAAKALIIDVRGNHGGSTPDHLVDALMDRPYRWWAESTPVSIALFDYYAGQAAHPPKYPAWYRNYLEAFSGFFTHAQLYWPATVQKPQHPVFHGRLLILTDGGCFSACEDFVEPFRDNHRATLVGETTAGSSGQPFSRHFSNGMGFGINTKREYFPDGSPFEGVGIVPDVPVPLTEGDLASGRDPVLARAVEIAAGR